MFVFWFLAAETCLSICWYQ